MLPIFADKFSPTDLKKLLEETEHLRYSGYQLRSRCAARKLKEMIDTVLIPSTSFKGESASDPKTVVSVLNTK